MTIAQSLDRDRLRKLRVMARSGDRDEFAKLASMDYAATRRHLRVVRGRFVHER